MAVDEVGVEELERVLADERRTILVDFWGPWCAPCRTLRPHLERLAAERRADTRVVAVNLDREPEAGERFEVQAVPTIDIYRNGRRQRRFTGTTLPGVLVAALDAAADRA